MHKEKWWKLIIYLNFAFGLLLWFFTSSEFSFVGKYSDILAPFIVGGLAVFTYYNIKDKNIFSKKLLKFFHFPSILIGVLAFIIGFVSMVPPFTLGALFVWDEFKSQVKIQESISPNKELIASVFYEDTGAIGSGIGHITVSIHHRYFPIIEKQVYTTNDFWTDKDTLNYISWKDGNTLIIAENNQSVKLDKLKFQIPFVLQIPVVMVIMIGKLIDYSVTSFFYNLKLNDIPIYPGEITRNNTNYNETYETSTKRYTFSNSTINEVVDWYITDLTKSDWEIILIEEFERDLGGTYFEYCIHATKTKSGKEINYFWAISQSTNNEGFEIVRVHVSSPNPNLGACYHHRKIIDK